MIGIILLNYFLKRTGHNIHFFSPTSYICHRVKPVVCFVCKALDCWSVGDWNDAVVSGRDQSLLQRRPPWVVTFTVVIAYVSRFICGKKFQLKTYL